jgi:hypothetical protein
MLVTTRECFMHLCVSQPLGAAARRFLGLALSVLCVYLLLANLSLFLDALGWFDSELVRLTDRFAVVAAVTAGVLGALCGCLPLARRPGVETIELVAETLVRYSLGFILPVYGSTKILHVQFRLPFAALDTPLGDASGMALTWRFSGYSYFYELFLGLGEFVGAGLLFFRRTTTLGACILLPILANVALLNFTHNISVKFYSTCYVLMVCYLVGLDWPRLSALFLENKGFGPRPVPPWSFPPRIRSLLGPLKAGYMVLAVVHAFAFILIADSRPSVVCGSWVVLRSEFVASNSGDLPPPLVWTKVFFERDIRGVFVGSVKEHGTEKGKAFRYEVSPNDQRLALTFKDPSSGPPFNGSYQFLDDRTLRLAGNVGAHRIEILLARRK